MRAAQAAALLSAAAPGGAREGSGGGGFRPPAVRVEYVPFPDAPPSPAGAEKQISWMALGRDDGGRVYVAFNTMLLGTACPAAKCPHQLDPRGLQDTTVFSYDPSSRTQRYHGSFVNASRAAGSLWPDEEIPKGHTHISFVDGKMYLGSQNFHDWKHAIDTSLLDSYHGGHIYAVDTRSGALEDVTAAAPGGVAVAHEGIVALARVPGRPLLVGLSHPYSSIVVFDYEARAVRAVVPGIPWADGNPLSREIVATRGGKVYTYRGVEEPHRFAASFPVWAYDLDSGAMAPTGFNCSAGFWNGQTRTRDGGTVYVSTVLGNLYRLDVDTGTWSALGHFLPAAEYARGTRVDQLYGVALTPDERYVVGIVSGVHATSGAAGRGGDSNRPALYAYDVAAGAVGLVRDLPHGIYTGGDDVRDSGSVYFMGAGGCGDPSPPGTGCSNFSWALDNRMVILHFGRDG